METIKDKDGNTEAIKISWSIEDVYATAENMGIQLTNIEAGEILDDVLHDHDATIGINWDVLEFHIKERINQ